MFGMIMAVHALVALSMEWSVACCVAIAYKPTSDVTRATAAVARPPPLRPPFFTGPLASRACILPRRHPSRSVPHLSTVEASLLSYESSKAPAGAQVVPAGSSLTPQLVGLTRRGGETSFELFRRRFVWDDSEKCFRKVAFGSKEAFSHYLAQRGHSGASAAAAREAFGPNSCQLPPPQFWPLLRDQMLAPFFCFQASLPPASAAPAPASEARPPAAHRLPDRLAPDRLHKEPLTLAAPVATPQISTGRTCKHPWQCSCLHQTAMLLCPVFAACPPRLHSAAQRAGAPPVCVPNLRTGLLRCALVP